MNSSSMHVRRGSQNHGSIVLFVLALVVATSGGAAITTTSAGAQRSSGSYAWPVKPFDRPHPVRGNFGDPRTTFYRKASPSVLYGGDGNFDYHFGIDIAVPDGTPVYPLRSGTVSLPRDEEVVVDSGSLSFEYWHIVPAVADGEYVEAFRAVLGRVRKGYEHVHLTELEGGEAVNPLAPGHLRPYADHTRPQVTSISFRRPGRPTAVIPDFGVHGRVEIVAAAGDMPAMRVKGRWKLLPVAPALVAWKLVRVIGRRTVVSRRVAFDVRLRLPTRAFWSTYARGTRQNMPIFGTHRFWRQNGVYLYRLAPNLDTRSLGNGVYDLVVTVSDTRGNHRSLTQRFTILN